MSHLTLHRPMTHKDVMGDFSTGNIKITSDIDSFLISYTLLEPYQSKLHFQLVTGDGVISEVQTLKFTKYLQKRDEIFTNLPPNDPFCIIHSEFIDPKNEFYEFELGYINHLPLYCVFQYNETSTFFQQQRDSPTTHATSPLRMRHAFLDRFVLPAARDLPALSKSAKTGVTSAVSFVKNKYNIYPTDWPHYAKCLTERLRAASHNFEQNCAMTYVRFVICLHGLRATKPTAEKIFTELLRVSHPHVHIVQIHRADELEPPEGMAVLAQLDANKLRNFTVRRARTPLFL